ncbi:MAG: enoyl-CoA hydratase/isomerase family protein [Ferrimicrobium sp.]
MEEFVKVTVTDEGIAVVTIDRPKANALSRALLVELGIVAEALAIDPPKAVVITGSQRIFAAGAEISEFGDVETGRAMGLLFHRTLDTVASIPRPVIAAIEGYALGGGCELALAADFRVAGDSARFGQPEILLGIIPGGGGTQRLPRLVGAARAKELIWSGRTVEAAVAQRIGLVDRVVPAGAAREEALSWAREFTSGAVVAMGLAKAAIDGGMGGTLSEGLSLERALFAQVFSTDDAHDGVASFFANGPGKAQFHGR